MATTKTAEKKAASKKAPVSAPPDPLVVLSDEILITQIHQTLVRLGEPARAAEIARTIATEIEDGAAPSAFGAISAGLARRVMEAHPRRFVAVDRRWDVTSRYIDKQRPVERVIEEIIGLYGAPMPIDFIASELALIYDRVREHFDVVAPRLVGNTRFFTLNAGSVVGLRAWLLNTESEKEDDLLFYNYLSAASVAPFAKAATSNEWESDPVAAAAKVIAAGKGQPVDNRVIQYLAHKALGVDFDPVAIYSPLHTDSRFLVLPNHRWLAVSALGPLEERWAHMASQVVESAPEDFAAEVSVESAAPPLEITVQDDLDIRRYFEDRRDLVSVGDLLTNVFELRPGTRSFAADAETLGDYLRARPNDFQWVGTDRFRLPGTLPPYIGQIPDSLRFPTLPRFETPDGEILDQLLSDQVFEDSLANEILEPVAQDVGDQEPDDRTVWPEGVSAGSQSLRIVLKAHHKEIGTFPLAQVPFGFFPNMPKLVEITLHDANGSTFPAYVDYTIGLVYGLFELYMDIAAESGAVFTLEKMQKPAEYRFTSNNETDSHVFVNPSRLEELADYRSEVESGSPISTYDIIRRILDHYRKGCSFLTLLTEVNLVRRTPRRLVASILSGYSAFHPRANRWTFDPKKEPEGFDKRKAEYIIKK